MTPDKPAETSPLATRLLKLVWNIPFFGIKDWWENRETYEDALRQAAEALKSLTTERDTARARLAEVERERNDAYDDADHNADQVATLTGALRWYASYTDDGTTARHALKAVGVGP